MLFPSDRISTADIIAVKVQSLYLSIDQRYSLMWIVESKKKRYAVHIDGSAAPTGFEIWNQAPGYGLQIQPVLIRVNPASVAAYGVGWNLKAADGALWIGFFAGDQNPQKVWAPVASLKTATKSSAFFSEWSAGVEYGGEWIELVTASSHDIKTNTDLTTPVS
jgi:hypothetical protein